MKNSILKLFNSNIYQKNNKKNKCYYCLYNKNCNSSCKDSLNICRKKLKEQKCTLDYIKIF